MLYSMKMRSALGGDHRQGGQHISGAERILSEDDLMVNAQAMIARALNHSRGKADFIQLKIEAIPQQQIQRAKLLKIVTHKVETIREGRQQAKCILSAGGVTEQAIAAAFDYLDELPTSMRGAMLVDAVSGRRLDDFAMRGVRVSNMDIANEDDFSTWLSQQKLMDIHVREAAVLAAKVAAHQDVVAELCWSDDPEYVIGYVADKTRYQRITKLKEQGSWQGGRVFFIRPDANIGALIDYLQNQPILMERYGKQDGFCDCISAVEG